MTLALLEKCPRCSEPLEAGFAGRSVALSFVAPAKLQHFVFGDEDVGRAGLRRFLPHRAEYFRSCLCRSCQLYVIDFGTTLSRASAEQIASQLIRHHGAAGT